MGRTRFLALLCLQCALAPSALSAAELYRYVDQKGVTVLDRQGVPPELVGKGYEVLNEQGRVIREIPPAPTAAERQRREKEALQARTDRRLLRLYASVADVERARNRKLAEIDSLIDVSRGNLQSLKVQQGNLLGKAAEIERSGKQVPESIVSQLAALKGEQQRLQQEIDRYQDARTQADASFTSDRQRIAELLGG